MKLTRGKGNRSDRRTGAIAILCAMALLFNGCYAARVEQKARNLTGDSGRQPRSLQRQVAVAAFTNQSALTAYPIEADFREHVMAIGARACPGIRFHAGDGPSDAPVLNPVAQGPDGAIDGYALALNARKEGLGAVVTGAVTNIRGEEDTIGFWWFEEPLYLVSVHASTVVYDSETGAKLLDEDYFDQIQIDADQFERLMANDLTPVYGEIDEALARVAEELGSRICAVLKDQPFKAYVASLQENAVTLSIGGDAGIEVGKKFGVYDSSKTITAATGARYLIPGTRVGALKIITVSPDTAQAEVISGEVPNALVCLKPLKDPE